MATINTENRNLYTLITGATGGIGYEFTKLFAQDGYNLILIAGNPETLQQVANEIKQDYGVEVTPMAKNLLERNASQEIFDAVKKMGITVNILVNIASQDNVGQFMSSSLESDIDLIQVNIISLLSLTKLFGREMVNRNEGKILQVGSCPCNVPPETVYAATKAFIRSFSLALRNELIDTGVNVTLLIPGEADTESYAEPGITEIDHIKQLQGLSPAEVAKDGYKTFISGDKSIMTGDGIPMSHAHPDTAVLSAARKISKPPFGKDSESRTGSLHAVSIRDQEARKDQTARRVADCSREVPRRNSL